MRKTVPVGWGVVLFIAACLAGYVYMVYQIERPGVQHKNEWQEISRDTISLEEAQQYDTLPRRYKIVFE